MLIRERLPYYAYLMRLDKPIGILLLLWPTLWALWLAGAGHPDSKILFIFVVGVVLMRSAGCVMNDVADRHVDGHVERTRNRPLASGKVTTAEALMLAALLSLAAFLLVLFCNLLTITMACVGVLLMILYPFMKRFTHLPQLGLGVAFTWGVPMAFTAEMESVPSSAWFLFLTGMVWSMIYDTMYAMMDRKDDLKMGIKSSAILFAGRDKFIIGLLQILFVVMLIIVGLLFHLHCAYYLSLVPVGLLFSYQQWLIKDRDREPCFTAFLNNNWVGLAIFIGILLSYVQ
jgi:4-hydroxybenzoate polyprenyltransferase